MRKKLKNRTSVYEFLNKYELADLKAREIEHRPERKMGFKCHCGCTEFIDLRDGFGECRECKAPYTVENDRRNKIYRGLD